MSVTSSIRLWLGAILVAPSLSFGAIAVNPSWDAKNGPCDARLVPVGPKLYTLKATGQDDQYLVHDPLGMWNFEGEGGWKGEEHGDYQTLVRRRPRQKFPERLLFRRGRLIYAEARGRKFDVRFQEKPSVGAALSGLWPETPSDESAADIWRGGSRLRLWYLNPNAAGALFAEIAVVGLAFVLFSSGWLRMLGGLFALTGLVGLVLTASRGGMVALLAALAVFLATWVHRRGRDAWRRYRSGVLLGLTTALVVACAVCCHLGRSEGRRGFFSQDERTDRVTIWRAVPAMIADAPAGWGGGQAGEAYSAWYQPLHRSHVVRTLLNTHFTWLVEFGTTFRVAYVFGWLFALSLVTLAVRKSGPLPLAALVFWGVALFFNHLGEEWTLWLLPILSLLPIVRQGFCVTRRMMVWTGGLALVVAVLTAFLPGLVCGGGGKAPDGAVVISKRACGVVVGRGQPEICIVADSNAGCVSGGNRELGREVRQQISVEKRAPTVCVVTSLEQVPRGVRRLVVLGWSCRSLIEADCPLPAAEEIVLVSPPFAPSAVPESLRSARRVKMLVGELATRYWQNRERETIPEWVSVVSRCELYLPDWCARVFNPDVLSSEDL